MLAGAGREGFVGALICLRADIDQEPRSSGRTSSGPSSQPSKVSSWPSSHQIELAMITREDIRGCAVFPPASPTAPAGSVVLRPAAWKLWRGSGPSCRRPCRAAVNHRVPGRSATSGSGCSSSMRRRLPAASPAWLLPRAARVPFVCAVAVYRELSARRSLYGRRPVRIS